MDGPARERPRSVGSKALFIQLGAATIPSWTAERQFEDPRDAPPPSNGIGFVPEDEPEPPEIVFDEVVGAYEVVVLDAASAADVLAFFEANDYAFEDSATPIRARRVRSMPTGCWVWPG